MGISQRETRICQEEEPKKNSKGRENFVISHPYYAPNIRTPRRSIELMKFLLHTAVLSPPVVRPFPTPPAVLNFF
jgi:hypothetical protein